MRAEIEKYLTPYLWLLPQWCLDFQIYDAYSEESSEVAADCQCDYKYRRVVLTFYSNWFVQTERNKEQALIHELLHAFINPLYHYAKEIAEGFAEDNVRLKQALMGELKERNEAITQDLSFAIFNKFNEHSRT